MMSPPAPSAPARCHYCQTARGHWSRSFTVLLKRAGLNVSPTPRLYAMRSIAAFSPPAAPRRAAAQCPPRRRSSSSRSRSSSSGPKPPHEQQRWAAAWCWPRCCRAAHRGGCGFSWVWGKSSSPWVDGTLRRVVRRRTAGRRGGAAGPLTGWLCLSGSFELPAARLFQHHSGQRRDDVRQR